MYPCNCLYYVCIPRCSHLQVSFARRGLTVLISHAEQRSSIRLIRRRRNRGLSFEAEIKGIKGDCIDEDKVTIPVSCCALIIRQQRPAAHLLVPLLCPLFSFPLPSEITYNICQRTDTADGAVTIALQRNPLEKCPLYYLSEAIYRTLSSLFLFSFRFSVFLLPSCSSPRLCAPGLASKANSWDSRCCLRSLRLEIVEISLSSRSDTETGIPWTCSLLNLVYVLTKNDRDRSIHLSEQRTICYICVNYIASAVATRASR